jgi:hypothetical protein
VRAASRGIEGESFFGFRITTGPVTLLAMVVTIIMNDIQDSNGSGQCLGRLE